MGPKKITVKIKIKVKTLEKKKNFKIHKSSFHTLTLSNPKTFLPC